VRRLAPRSAAAALALALVLGVAACADLPGRPRPSDRPVRPTAVTDFGELWGANCAGCHGRDGALGAARPLNDPLYLAWADDAALERAIAAGVPGTAMPAFARSRGGTLTDAQIAALIEGMRQRWAKPGTVAGVELPAYAAAPGDAARGGEAYATVCAHCHGAKGEGGRVPGAIVDDSYLALVSDGALRATVVVGRRDLGMPDWRSALAGRPMSEAEIADVVAWLAAQRAPFPGRPAAPADEEEVDG
jgi:cytochrome c oxidase cbb3-type subunit 3/ubiquinol-cytochrome c reductase cytochrome c subunit